MDYGEFKEKFTQDVKDRLKEEGSNIIISVNEVKKLNERYEAITAVAEGDNIGVNVGIEKFYGAYEDGASYGSVVDKAIEVIKTGIGHKPEINVEDLGDYSKMKDKLIMEVVSAEANKEMLENIPHQMLEDMAVVYRFAVESADSVQGSILITDTMVAHFGITPEQLHADAMENAPQIKPIEIKGMSEVLVEMMGVEQAEMMGLADLKKAYNNTQKPYAKTVWKLAAISVLIHNKKDLERMLENEKERQQKPAVKYRDTVR